jgi:hypothetical protein
MKHPRSLKEDCKTSNYEKLKIRIMPIYVSVLFNQIGIDLLDNYSIEADFVESS